jgi:hypothetical protein
MAERIRLDRDHPARAPEEAVIESWVENVGVYLMIPTGDPRRTPRATDGRPASAKRYE